jgi:hypothetical protein
VKTVEYFGHVLGIVAIDGLEVEGLDLNVRVPSYFGEERAKRITLGNPTLSRKRKK